MTEARPSTGSAPERRQWSVTRPPGKVLTARRARALSRIPAFATCPSRQLRLVARWGDVIEVDAGEELARQDRSDWWFFVVVSGRVVLTRDARSAGELLPGSHFGETAVIGLRPQQFTAIAAERSVLFVLGPRYVLSLLSLSASFRHAVLPKPAATDYRSFARRMYDTGQEEWSRLSARRKRAGDPAGVTQRRAPTPRAFTGLASSPTSKRGTDRLPGRPLSLAEAVQAFAGLPPPPQAAPMRRRVPLRRRWLLGLGAIVGAVAAGVLVLYHPPRLLLTAGRPIDVLPDIRVTGAATYQPSGHYLMLWVKASRPDLAGLLVAWVEGRTTLPLPASREIAERAAGRAQYLDSQRTAIRLAVTSARLDPHRVSVHIRDRGFVGPSAGLAYALAVEDLLTHGDSSRGRVIGVTGALLPDGAVEPIGWLRLKARAASEAHATLLVVPAEETADAAERLAVTCGVTTLHDALQALADPGADLRCASEVTR